MKKRIVSALVAVMMLLSILPSTVYAANVNRFTGLNARIYEKIEAGIAQVAAGSRSSTVFELSLADVGLDGHYTAADLGVDDLLDEEGSLAEDADNAMKDVKKADLAAIAHALMLSCPYDLYWFDKTKGVNLESGIDTIAGDYDDNGELYLYFEGEYAFRFSFTVASEYAAGLYEVKTSEAQTAWNYQTLAQEIIDRYANASDYEKLDGYRQEICTLASYNHAGKIDYGNAWQATWVFDGAEDTAVVCEGYAKAFQYLCDNTHFNSSAVRCYTVTGTLSGGTGDGSHMWNIVAMDDGANYLADLTNCDEGTIGADDLLFLKGYQSVDENGNYTFAGLDEAQVHYTYDDIAHTFYTDAELALSATDYVPLLQPELSAAAMSLGENIGLHFYVSLDESAANGAYMDFAWGDDKTATSSAQLISTGDYAGDTRFTCPLSAKELYDTVKATLRDQNGKKLGEYTYSGAQYLNALVDNQPYSSALRKLARATLTYGAAARYYFRGGESVSVTAISPSLVPPFLQSSMVIADGDVRFYGKSLLTKDVLRLRLYFAAPEAPVVLVANKSVAVDKVEDGFYKVDIPIVPDNLQNGFQVRVSGTGIQFTVGVNDYIATALKQSANPALKTLVYAIYHYGVAVQSYLHPEEQWGPLH